MKKKSICNKKKERIRWLEQHRNLWVGFPQFKMDMSAEYYKRQRKIIALMREKGLFSPKTHDFDINLLWYINHIRKQKWL